MGPGPPSVRNHRVPLPRHLNICLHSQEDFTIQVDNHRGGCLPKRLPTPRSHLTPMTLPVILSTQSATPLILQCVDTPCTTTAFVIVPCFSACSSSYSLMYSTNGNRCGRLAPCSPLGDVWLGPLPFPQTSFSFPFLVSFSSPSSACVYAAACA